MSSNVRGASVSSANYADMSKNLAKDLEKDIDK
jgi:hypothetical protein